MLRLSLILALAGCGKMIDDKSPNPSERLEALKSKYNTIAAEAASLRDAETGWLARTDCDGIVWAGKYAVAADGVNIEAAEYPDEPGRYSRRPFPACWTADSGDQGSKTTWSRDMAVAGLLPWAYLRGRRDVLEKHASYGSAHDWVMGEPSENRVVYTPQLIGLLYRLIHGLGGALDERAIVPYIAVPGLSDYELHLQMNAIWLDGRVNADAVSQRQLDLLRAAVDTEPRDPFYRYILGEYTGDLEPAIGLLLEDGEPQGGYVRCEAPRECQIAAWLFAAHLTIQRLTGAL